MSVSGGLHNAMIEGKRVACDVVQLFSKNSNQWNAKPLSVDDIALFKKTRDETGIVPMMVHSSYLINLCTPIDAAWMKSLEALYVEMERVEALEIPYLVLHPGAHVGSGVEAGVARAAAALNMLHSRTAGFKMKILIELTAGQGTCIGHRFEEVGDIFKQTTDRDRMGICFDTCHVFAAGYDMRTKEQYEETMASLDQFVGLDYVKAFHINDCKKELGCRVDRHEHIGQGKMGIAPFTYLMNDLRFLGLPMVLETPKGVDLKEDVINLSVLRGL